MRPLHADGRGARGALLLLAACALGCSSAPRPEQPPESSPKPRASAQAAPAPRAASGNAPAAAAAAPAPAQAASAQAAQEATDVEQALAYDPKDPLANLEAADALDHMARRPEGKGDARPPRGGCALLDAGMRVWPVAGPSAIAAVGKGFVVAGYAQHEGREQIFVVHVPAGGTPEPIAAFEVKPAYPRARTAPPGLDARDENDLTVAFVDGDGKLWARGLRVGRGGGGAAVEIASAVDARFAPALTANEDRTLLAWTAGSTPMHTHLAVLSSEGRVLSRHDVTPAAMGAAAPSFVSGANPPVLVALDAREGMSPILRIDIGNHGEPQPAQVALPVGMVLAPPQLAAASSSVGTYVAYTGLGSAATSAIGLVAIAPVAGHPEALVKGTAYGPLYLSAAAAPRALLFAADAPMQPGKDPPHEIHVHVVGMRGPGPAAVIRAPGGASHASLARAEGGSVGVAFTAPAGVYLARLRCDDGG